MMDEHYGDAEGDTGGEMHFPHMDTLTDSQGMHSASNVLVCIRMLTILQIRPTTRAQCHSMASKIFLHISSSCNKLRMVMNSKVSVSLLLRYELY